MSDVTEYNAITGETKIRKFTKSEKDFVSSLKVDGQDQIDSIIAEMQQKDSEKQAALVALKDLGLTESQAKAVIGI